jgi:hypothetical protein
VAPVLYKIEELWHGHPGSAQCEINEHKGGQLFAEVVGRSVGFASKMTQTGSQVQAISVHFERPLKVNRFCLYLGPPSGTEYIFGVVGRSVGQLFRLMVAGWWWLGGPVRGGGRSVVPPPPQPENFFGAGASQFRFRGPCFRSLWGYCADPGH